MKTHYAEIKNSDMLDLFPAEDIRLIRDQHKHIPGGISEISIKIDMKKAFAKKLSFKTPWDNEIFGFVKCKNKLFGKTGTQETAQITITDCDDSFTVIFEDTKGNESPVFKMDSDYVKNMLEACRKPESLV